MSTEFRSHVVIGTDASPPAPKIRCHACAVKGLGTSDSGLFAASGSVLKDVAIWMRNG